MNERVLEILKTDGSRSDNVFLDILRRVNIGNCLDLADLDLLNAIVSSERQCKIIKSIDNMFLFFTCVLSTFVVSHTSPSRSVYTNQWAVRITGGREEADKLASKYGYRNLGQVNRKFMSFVRFMMLSVKPDCS